MVIPEALKREIARFALKKKEVPLSPLLEELSCRYPGVEAVLFYGSCLQQGSWRESLIDLYVLVRSYRQAYDNPALALANYLLPPNVFYLEKGFDHETLRSKYAVMSLAQFLKATSPSWFHSYFWARFAQPTAMVYASSQAAQEATLRALAQAVLTFLSRVFPVLPPEGRLKDLWLSGLRLSYRAELRPEPEARLERLWASSQDYFYAITQAALSGLPFKVRLLGDSYQAEISPQKRKWASRAWRLRIVQGKVLSVLRLAKAAFTFQGGVDYALWKIERHTHRRFHVPESLRGHPFLALLLLGWQVLKEGGVR